jgi:hypothetical protein
MEHFVIYKRDGYYSAWPVPALLPDGRIAIQVLTAPFADHYGLDECFVLISEDRGETFHLTDDPSLPLGWPGANPRERNDRYAGVQPNGDYLALGTVGFEVWPLSHKADAEAMQAAVVLPHPNGSMESMVVKLPKLFVARSRDQGKTWQRQEKWVPGFTEFYAFPRWVQLHDGVILLPIFAVNLDGSKTQELVFRFDPQTELWQLLPMSSSISDVRPDETAFLEVSAGRVLALMRHLGSGTHNQGYLLESWSEDGGRTWSQLLRTDIKGYPPHLLRLQDGRILCTYGVRNKPMGVQAVLSDDDGRTWNTRTPIVLRDDGGTPSSLWANREERTGGADVGYPITLQLADGTLYTIYYITLEDGITHIAGTRWCIDEVA